MQVIFQTPDPQAIQLRQQTTRRVRQAMKRLAWLDPRVKVHLSDVNGPCGGIDKSCRIELMSERTGTVVITSLAKNWSSALQSALTRAVRALLNNWQRTRTRTRALKPNLSMAAA